MNRDELLKQALGHLAEVHDSYSAMERGDLGAYLAKLQVWAREQQATIDAAAVFSEPEAIGAREVIGAMFDAWQKALARCTSDEEIARTHEAFARAVNAFCELASAPVELKLRGAA